MEVGIFYKGLYLQSDTIIEKIETPNTDAFIIINGLNSGQKVHIQNRKSLYPFWLQKDDVILVKDVDGKTKPIKIKTIGKDCINEESDEFRFGFPYLIKNFIRFTT